MLMDGSCQNTLAEPGQIEKPRTENNYRGCDIYTYIEKMENIANIPPLSARRKYKAMLEANKYRNLQ